MLIVASGLITGPRENVPRLSWWLRRTALGGRVLAPGDPGRELSLIDARDIAAFGIDRVAAGDEGRYLVVGETGAATFGGLLKECADVTGSGAEFVWADDTFLAAEGVETWTELPMWAPGTPEYAGIWRASEAKAVQAGLRHRSIAETVRDTWEHLGEGEGQGIDPAKEERVLARWAER